MDIVTRFFHAESCDIHLNHGDLLEAIWSWAGIKAEHREKVAEVYALLCLWDMHDWTCDVLTLILFGWSFLLWWVLCVLNHLNGSQSGWLLGVSFCRFEETYRISSTFSSLKLLHQHTNSRRQNCTLWWCLESMEIEMASLVLYLMCPFVS